MHDPFVTRRWLRLCGPSRRQRQNGLGVAPGARRRRRRQRHGVCASRRCWCCWPPLSPRSGCSCSGVTCTGRNPSMRATKPSSIRPMTASSLSTRRTQQVLYTNPAFCDRLGYTDHEAQALDPARYFCRRQRHSRKHPGAPAGSGFANGGSTCSCRCKNGSVHRHRSPLQCARCRRPRRSGIRHARRVAAQKGGAAAHRQSEVGWIAWRITIS